MWSAADGRDAAVLDQGADFEIVLDLSRLISRILHSTPTGIDRVEMAYARELQRMIPGRLSFAAVNPWGFYGRLSPRAVGRFLDHTEKLWNGEGPKGAAALRVAAARKLLALLPLPTPPRPEAPRVYLQASPHHLHKPALVERILRRENAQFVCLVHDLIPIEYPEYARPGGAALHCRRIDTLGTFADALIANSHATARSLERYLGAKGPVPPISVAHLGTSPLAVTEQPPGRGDPYFVSLGTIEPRKNHLLLLNIWRRLVEEAREGQTIPKLILIGRRGWENENVVDMLERCPQLTGHVIEASRLNDREAEDVVRRSSGMLMPSFAEGYGMPVAEALTMGVPVICSDLPALREVGGENPVYLDPLDGSGWLREIRRASAGDEPATGAERWVGPAWSDHLAIVLDQCAALQNRPKTTKRNSALAA